MRRILVFAIFSMLGSLCSAEVLRCTDAAGKVSYTDSTCPTSAKRVGRVDVTEPLTVTDPGVPPPAPREPPQAAFHPPPQPAPPGPVIVDTHSTGSGNNNYGNDPVVADDGYYPYYGGGYRQPRPPRDMRPRLHNCDSAGCNDTQGNHYNRSGQVDRYTTLGGKTCTPVGTTQICR